ncbi:hypothetical protein ACFL2O_10115 [Thermodesulfobacteriota bacterium]
MRRRVTIIAFLVFILSPVGHSADNIELLCHVNVPDEFKQDPPGWIPPNGEPESIRYTKTYEAFWWNCVMVKAEGLGRRCPFTCSGTPGATSGCPDGADDAEKQIMQLLKYHDAKEVMEYLKTLAKNSIGLSKIKPYFPDGPCAEKVPE